ncbi:nuclear transport factor 2 family protein [Terasakiella sp. SH-1]|uniref:nuclear transport factor 2 family protein n=1 Tax=Terasakiella sp. SH-1 TaxID=2560057 RepID=UPI0010738A81|nr:nuclear transport factor 2 family protein [Terasakiella sp. SH-1]
MLNRVKTADATKEYAQAMNAGDVATVASLLDNDVIFSRQEQNSIVGKENVLRRIRNLFWRLDEQNQSLQLINAIVDLGQSKARPCLICLRNGLPVALCVLSCKANGMITAVAVLLTGDIVASARATEPMPSVEDTQDEVDPQRRKLWIDVTKSYIGSFNQRDLAGLSYLLDERETVFHRSDQQAIIGKNNILDRIRDLYRRIDKHGQHLAVVNAIIDLDDQKARPCTLGVLDGVPVSVGILRLRNDGVIRKIDMIMDQEVVAKARATEEIPKPPEKSLELQQVLEREEWLYNRLKKIKMAMKKQGNLPHLITKKMRVEMQLEKIEYLKKKLS